MDNDHDETPDPAATLAAARRWKAAWESNWAAGTLHDNLPLYAEDAVYCTFPFREPDIGHDAISSVFDTFQASATEVECTFGEPMVDGDRAVFEWWVTWLEDGTHMTMAGISKVWFNAEGLVVRSRDYWNTVANERHEPYEGWDRS